MPIDQRNIPGLGRSQERGGVHFKDVFRDNRPIKLTLNKSDNIFYKTKISRKHRQFIKTNQ